MDLSNLRKPEQTRISTNKAESDILQRSLRLFWLIKCIKVNLKKYSHFSDFNKIGNAVLKFWEIPHGPDEAECRFAGSSGPRRLDPRNSENHLPALHSPACGIDNSHAPSDVAIHVGRPESRHKVTAAHSRHTIFSLSLRE